MPQKLKVPGFSYRNFDMPNLSLGAELIQNLGTSEEAYKLAPKSTPLAWRIALYTVGRDLEIGEPLADELPESVKEAGRLVYKDAHDRKARNASGCWHKEAIKFLPMSEKPRGVFAPEGYALARHFRDAIFVKEGNIYRIQPSEKDPEGALKLIPKGGGSFIVPTKYEIYDPDGMPEATEADMEKAVRMWVNWGLTEKQARNELSRFYRMNESTAAVGSWSGDYDGPLCVNLDFVPGCRYSVIGSFAASSSAERSEARKKNGFVNLEKEEYKSLLKDRATLEKVRKDIST